MVNIDESTLAQTMAWCLMAPSHYLNQCWLIIKEVLWHSPQSNLIRSAHELKLYHVFRDYTFKITATSLTGQWINRIMLVLQTPTRPGHKHTMDTPYFILIGQLWAVFFNIWGEFLCWTVQDLIVKESVLFANHQWIFCVGNQNFNETAYWIVDAPLHDYASRHAWG